LSSRGGEDDGRRYPFILGYEAVKDTIFNPGYIEFLSYLHDMPVAIQYSHINVNSYISAASILPPCWDVVSEAHIVTSSAERTNITLITAAVSTSETSLISIGLHGATSKNSHLHIRHRESLKSHLADYVWCKT
jgi:hypothetical protein